MAGSLSRIDGRGFRFSLALGLGAVTLIALLVGMEANPRTWLLARNTLYLAFGVCSLALPWGVPLAVLLVRTDVPGRTIALAILGAMLFVPLYLQAAAWDAGFGQQGWFSVQQGNLEVPLLFGWRAVVWIHAMAAIPWVVLIVGAGLRLVEPELEETALFDMSPLDVILRVTLPRTWPAIGAAGLWIVITLAGEMTVTDLYRVRTYAEEVYTGFAQGDTPQEVAIGVLPGIAVVGVSSAAALLLAVAIAPAARLATSRRAHRFELGAWRWPLAGLVVIAMVVIAGIPVGDFCYQAGIKVTMHEGVRIRQWSLEKLIEIVGRSPLDFRKELHWTLLVGASSATLAAAISIPLAWLARGGGWRAWPAIAMGAVCLAVPGPLVGLAVVALFQIDLPGVEALYSRTLLAPTLAIAVRAFPIALLIHWYALASVSPELLESAAVDGAGPVSRFFRIALPLRAPALAAGWLAAFAIATGDLAASILAVPPGVDLLSIRIFGLVHYGVTDRLAGICLVNVGALVLLAIVTATIWRRGQRIQ